MGNCGFFTFAIFVYSVDIMKRKLDPEGLDIILLSSFMDEFYPEERQTTPDTFTIFHYNGLPHSCPNGKVRGTHFLAVYPPNYCAGVEIRSRLYQSPSSHAVALFLFIFLSVAF